MKASILTLAVVLGYFLTSSAQSPADQILGEWLSPKRDSRVLIYKDGDKYSGRIVWGTGGPPNDSKNPDPSLRARPLVGLVILTDFRFDESNEIWQDGAIYDPREGKTYSCKMSMNGVDELNIRGFLGISLFGRTEQWARLKDTTK